MRFFVRTSNYQNSAMLNICDEDLIERVLKQDNLEIKISKSYYGQRLVDEEEAKNLMRNSSILNIAGKESVEMSIDLKMGTRAGVKTVDGVPFLIIFQI
jgi:hypothetical protein